VQSWRLAKDARSTLRVQCILSCRLLPAGQVLYDSAGFNFCGKHWRPVLTLNSGLFLSFRRHISWLLAVLLFVRVREVLVFSGLQGVCLKIVQVV
jgi:hypothetical protein